MISDTVEARRQMNCVARDWTSRIIRPPVEEPAKDALPWDKDLGKGQRGGWFQKCLQLVQAVVHRKYERAEDLAEEYSEHPTMKPLVVPN